MANSEGSKSLMVVSHFLKLNSFTSLFSHSTRTTPIKDGEVGLSSFEWRSWFRLVRVLT
ncbi:uncharacterized protein J3R85_012783 [Psidium guajava]|nr:uncharacterized protein J3R85_012783 [Psidium guajava]